MIAVKEQDKYYYTLFKLAIEYNDPEEIIHLIKRGASVDLQDEKGITPLMFAIYKRRMWIAQLLIDNGADQDLEDKNGWTALTWSVHTHCPNGISILVKAALKKNKNQEKKNSSIKPGARLFLARRKSKTKQ